MIFEPTTRRGNIWNDAKKLHKFITECNFNMSNKKEKDFENGIASNLMNSKDFSADFISQVDNETTVKGAYCFGKTYRPDMAFGQNGIAVELKRITKESEGLKQAIGQAHIYRLKYRFVFVILVITKDKKEIYNRLCTNQEVQLEGMLKYLAKEMKIFTYIVPAFTIGEGQGMKKCHAFFDPT